MAARRTAGRRAQLAEIAAELFGERGYHEVGLGEIAAAAGITGPAIYRHFRGKREIFAHAARELTAALDECTAQAGDGDAARLEPVVRAVTELAVRRRGSLRLYQWEARHLDEDARAELTGRLRALIGAVAGLLARRRPELDAARARLLATAALSGIASWSTHRVALGDRAAEEALGSIAAVVLAADPPQAEPPAATRAVVPELAARREKLLAAAVPLFRERGFHPVSMEEIGAAAGINASGVYRHFSGKADLLAAAYYRATDRLTAATGRAVAAAGDAEAALEGLAGAYAEFAFANRDLLAVYLSEHRNLPAGDRHALRGAQRDHVRQWTELTERVRGPQRGNRTRVLVHGALNVINDLAMARFRAAAPEPARQLALEILRRA